ncbi:MAG: hypothetical protein FJ291_23750 [Planctomycetes bacterium]|nr:hypothetical protein [Planctomycetota bacterium]
MPLRKVVGGVSHAAFLCLLAAGCSHPLGATRSGFTRIGPVRHYSARNLYDAIDGEAPFVISFGFRSLAQATYGDKETPLFSIDLYDMGCEGNAFALYRAHVTLESKPLDVGSEGAGDDSRVEFWQGRFCVAVNALPSSKPVSAQAIAPRLAADLPPTKAWPDYLKLLPTQRRIARSEQYTPSDFLGHDFLRRAVSARYKLDGREATLFACRCDTEAQAASALARLQAVLQAKKPTQPLAVGHGGFTADDPALGPLAAFRRGRFLAGILRHGPDAATAEPLAELDKLLTVAGRRSNL